MKQGDYVTIRSNDGIKIVRIIRLNCREGFHTVKWPDNEIMEEPIHNMKGLTMRQQLIQGVTALLHTSKQTYFGDYILDHYELSELDTYMGRCKRALNYLLNKA